MSITAENIKHIAKLARLKTEDDKSQFYADQLNLIMNLVEQMNNIDTSGVEPMSHPQDAALRLRPDDVTKQNNRDRFQSIAPEAENGFYLVPKVIE